MNATSKTKSKSQRKSKSKPKRTPNPRTAAVARHRPSDTGHPGATDIDLDSNRSDLTELLTRLNPILREVVKRVREHPLEVGGEDAGCDAAGGYHNITYCEH